VRGKIWTVWAVLFGIAFLLLFFTKFTELFSDHGIPLTFTVLMAVGYYACVKLALQAVEREKSARP